MMLCFGLIIIAFHQFWRSAAAVIISLFGWFLALRGFILLAFPAAMQRGAEAGANVFAVMIAIFLPLMLAGGWLTFVGWIQKHPGA